MSGGPKTQAPQVVLIHGGGDVIETLERMLGQARQGELTGFYAVTLATEDGDPKCGYTWAYRDDEPLPWSRFVSAMAHGHHVLVTQGLV